MRKPDKTKTAGTFKTTRSAKPANPSKRAKAVKPVKKVESVLHPDARKICPAAGLCGACAYLGVPYEQQLKRKTEAVHKLLGSYGKVLPCEGCEQPFAYRNKTHAVLGINKDGGIISGTYQAGSHILVPVDFCSIENQDANRIIADIRILLASFKMKIYDEDTGRGLFRHILIRTAHVTGQIMVVLVLSSQILPSKNNFVKALLKLHPEIATIVLNVNDADTSMILGEKEIVLYGKGYIEDILGGIRFRISSRSFYQVNSLQAEKLYQKALELAGLSGKERVIDAYCGIGTISLLAAGRAREVYGVESNPDAIRDAIRNAKANGIKNARFFRADAGDFMEQLASEGEEADVVITDPPRSGCSDRFLKSLARLRPTKVIYISCNPQTQARDLKYLTSQGYRVNTIHPFDMFPQTEEIETVVCLLSN